MAIDVDGKHLSLRDVMLAAGDNTIAISNNTMLGQEHLRQLAGAEYQAAGLFAIAAALDEVAAATREMTVELRRRRKKRRSHHQERRQKYGDTSPK